jgi:hypothetical protein
MGNTVGKLVAGAAMVMAMFPAQARAEATVAICHSEHGACSVAQEEGADVVTFDCTCSDASRQVGEIDPDPYGLLFACATSLGVCGDGPVFGDDLAAPIHPPADRGDFDDEDAVAGAGCRIGPEGEAWLAVLLLPLLWRSRSRAVGA